MNLPPAWGWIAIAAVLYAYSARAADRKTVLVMTQGNGRQQSFVEFTAGLQRNLATNFHAPPVVYIENLDLQHFNSPDYRQEIIEWLRVKYQGRKLDAIVTENEQTADTAFKVRMKFWPEVPLVFVDSGRMEVTNIAARTNYTSLSAYPEVKETLQAALRLCPDTRRIAFVSSIGNGYVELYQRDLQQVESFAANRYEVIKLVGLTMAETKQRLAGLPPQTIVYYNGIWLDAAGQTYTTPDALDELSPACNAPIFSCADTHIGHGALGGSCRVYYLMGVETGEQVAKVIRTGNANSLPAAQSSSSRYIFDWRQLQRFGLDNNKLPAGSEVRFRPLTLWETHYDVVVIVAAALVMQTVLIAALLLQRRRKQQTEAELFNSRQMLQTVLDTIPQRVFWKDLNSVFLGCNKPLAEDCGYSSVSQLIGKTDHETTAAPQADRYRADDREVMETDRPKLNFEEPQKKADGSTGWLRTNKVPLHDKNGRVIGVLGTYEDITERKQAEEILRESEQRFRSLLDNAPDAVFVQTRKRIVYVNRAMLQLLRAERPEQLLGQPVLNVVAPEWQKLVAERMQQVNTEDGPVPAIEEEYLRLDKTRVEVEVTAVPAVFHGDRGALVFVRDITERKRSAETILYERELLRTLLDLLPDSVYIKDLDSRFLMANKTLAKRFGRENPSELLGLSDKNFFPAEQAAVLRAEEEKVIAGEILNEKEETFVLPDGQKHTLLVTKVPFRDKQGQICGLVGTGRDITERKRAAEMIVYERQLLRTLLDLLPDGVYIKDLNSCFLMANQTLAQRFGKDNPSRLLGFSDKDFFPPEIAAVFRADEEKVFAGQTVSEKEETVVFPNGQERKLLTTKVPFRNSEGQICGMVGIGRDITERKQLEEQLRQSQKMEAFGQLAGGVAHDFNNLLTVILGHIALLQLQESLNPEQVAGLTEITRAAERAANLTRQLLTFSRRQLFQPKPIDLNEVVASTSKMLQRLIGEHIGLETHFTPGGAPVMADRIMMEQVLINFAVNSRDAMPKGGRLVIQTAAVSIGEAEAQANPKSRPGAFIRLRVTDTGCGIALKEMERLFEPFFTTKEVGKGTGLGLATVFGIVAQHHGWIEVESKVNAGATFCVFLPRRSESQKSQTEFTRAPEVPGGNETILLVEDEAPVRSLARTLLERKGYHVIEADSGLSALEVWQERRDEIDLLFTDMVMPEGISGRELAARLIAEKPGLKVIYASGYTDDMLGENSPLRNNPNFLEKPFNSHKLLKQVRDCLDEQPKQG
jgi:two-component system, cell cycle sensor histidine kinase and response regulator CckA